MKLSDYLAQFIAEQRVHRVFLVIGGVCAHIVDSLGRSPDIEYVCMQHEQAAAMAVDAYSRMTDNFGVAVVTSGPGATNLITGVICAYFDSIPCLFISGQVNAWETKGDRKIRQLGFQETEVADMVSSITKYSVMVTDPLTIRYHLEKATYLARSGRPGPVWLDIPMNVQHAEIEPEKLRRFDPVELDEHRPEAPDKVLSAVAQKLKNAKRPVLLAGNGIKLGKAQTQFFAVLGKLKIPVVSTWSAIDLMPYDHPQYIGQFGVYGSRAANFTVANADVLLSIGSRLDSRQTGGQPQTFARAAFKIVVDIDQGELNKRWVKADEAVCMDAREFLMRLNRTLDSVDAADWLAKTHEWKAKYPIVLPKYYRQKGSVNSYVFVKSLSDALKEDDTIVVDQGGNLTWTIQGWQAKKGQRLFSAFGNSPMGYALPASIGAAFALPGKDIYCLDGDGGFQMNIQELQTIVHYKLPIKIFILNNHSYGIIKQFQEIYFESRYEATVEESGYSMPDFCKVAAAYGLATERISSHEELPGKLAAVLAKPGAVLCDVVLAENQKLIPKLIAIKEGDRYISKPIEDMAPLLPREEFLQNMFVPPVEEQGKAKSQEIN